MFLREKQWQSQTLSKSWHTFLIITFLILPFINHANGINDNNYGYSYLLFFIIATLTTILTLRISKSISTNKYIETISKGTLIVLGIHSPILHILDFLFPIEFRPIYPLITMFFCYFIIRTCEVYCPILMGKWPNTNACSQHRKIEKWRKRLLE